MQETSMLFLVSPTDFWKQIRIMMEEVVEQKLIDSVRKEIPKSHLPDKALLKASEVCEIFRVSYIFNLSIIAKGIYYNFY